MAGPVGGIIVGVLAGIAEPGGIALASLLAHIAGCIWMGFAYKKLLFEKLKMPVRILGWIGAVLVYYYVFAVAGFAVGLKLFYLESGSIWELYLSIAKGVVPELIFTAVITTLIWIGLPDRFRKPLW